MAVSSGGVELSFWGCRTCGPFRKKSHKVSDMEKFEIQLVRDLALVALSLVREKSTMS